MWSRGNPQRDLRVTVGGDRRVGCLRAGVRFGEGGLQVGVGDEGDAARELDMGLGLATSGARSERSEPSRRSQAGLRRASSRSRRSASAGERPAATIRIVAAIISQKNNAITIPRPP